MRFIFLVPDLDTRESWWKLQRIVWDLRLRSLDRFLWHRFMKTDQVFGGTLNIMRHCQVARNCGADAFLATMSGEDSYGEKGIAGLPFMRWQDRRHDDVCIVPDLSTGLISEVHGPVIAYLQSPIFVKNNFDFRDERVSLWTDSPFMLEICQRTYPGKEIRIVPNIIDNNKFPFIPQSEREPGLIFAFPRKGPDYIDQTEQIYRDMGGRYWKFERIHGLSIHELAMAFRRPQAFLASAEVEGCALPPQESMAAGVVVVGKNAKGANFCMEHRETAMTANTPEAAARCLFEIENPELRDLLTQNAYQAIKRYFPTEEPADFWRETTRNYQALLR
ncbi:glycosyltransferase [Leptolyngbya sp. NK1-12]|uniref:Glycosyltransferase n=2 Tax=Leptolyngbya sp. NK1-12 TaxID=2547451 RepID=A0AA96WAI0_9CYAN|nr:glycosyltransferase [Leptolyngbya sp. NK1-12]